MSTENSQSNDSNQAAATVARRNFLTRIGVCAAGILLTGKAFAVSPVKLQKWGGNIDFSPTELSPFTLSGTASHLGKFTAEGEVQFGAPDDDGALLGEGVVVFTAANGDDLVGIVEWEAGPEDEEGHRESHIHFSWRDSITFDDGTTASSTGRFAETRPPGLVVIAIIAILIGLLLPAVQKVR